MADLTDVMAAIATIVGAAIYPNGSSQPSALPNAAKMRIGPGWPVPSQLDADLAAGNGQITIFPLSGSAAQTYQILDETYLITPAAINLSFTISGSPVTVSGGGTTINVTGQPAVGEYLTVIADDAHIYSSGGATTAALLSALATQAQVNYPGATATATTLTVPVNAYLTVRQGGTAVMGKVVRRQRHSIMVTVWAPNDAIRTQAAILSDLALKEAFKISLPDTSQCILHYMRTVFSDQTESAALYRRDLIYDAEFATVQQFPGYVITSVQTSIAKPDNSAIATALT